MDTASVQTDFWTEVRHLDETTSTNDEVERAARRGAAEGLVVVAEHQTAGRGRLDRTWVSPRGAGLTFSVLLRPTAPDQHWTWLPLLTGLALAEAWSEVTGVELRLKWPNDLLVGERKVGGLLAARVDRAVVVGVGLNVTTAAADLPDERATSLVVEGSQALDKVTLLASGLDRLTTRYRAWSTDPAAAGLRTAYRQRCCTLGAAVRVGLPDGTSVEGAARDVDTAGRLVVATGSGQVALSVGDVVHVRSVG